MIELSRCDDFYLGGVRIRPSLREIVAESRATSIEPKVMQLLVVLAAQVGRVVPRDDLIEQCWQGRVVGEDAINRVIGKLRRAADDAAGGAFRIETVARVGLRLVAREQDALPLLPAPTMVRPRHVRHYRLLAIVGAVSLALMLGLWSWKSVPTRRPAINPATLPPAVTDLETRGLSAMFENTPERTAAGVTYLRQATAAAPQSAPT